MGKSLDKIAEELRDANKKVQLLYAFNGTGKTRLSRVFRQLVDPKVYETDENAVENSDAKIIYYSAYTVDLFYWDNDLSLDETHTLKILPNSFTGWVLSDQGKIPNVISHFQHYTNDKLTPHFISSVEPHTQVAVFEQVRFTFERGNAERSDFVKISKGEENSFIWCIFFSLIEQVIAELNISEPTERSSSDFNELEYIFIDDPVCSLDENHIIELAVDIAHLIKSSKSKVKFIITTHSPLFYNVLYSELGVTSGLILNLLEDGTFDLVSKKGDSNSCFSYHLYLKNTLQQAIDQQQIQRFHFNLLRNLYEKTAHFLGYSHWSDLLPGEKELYNKRIINFTSHSTLSNETVAEPTGPEKNTVSLLLNHLIDNYAFWKETAQ